MGNTSASKSRCRRGLHSQDRVNLHVPSSYDGIFRDKVRQRLLSAKAVLSNIPRVNYNMKEVRFSAI